MLRCGMCNSARPNSNDMRTMRLALDVGSNAREAALGMD